MPAGPRRLDRDALGRYVLSRHNPGSGYCFYRTPEWGVEEPNALDTLYALRSLRLLGLPVSESSATVEWLRSLQATDGSFATLTIGWAALLALDHLGAEPERSPSGWIEHECRHLEKVNGERDWATALRSALRIVEIGSIDHLALAQTAIDRLLEKGRDPQGGWALPGGDLESTAIALLLAPATSEEGLVAHDARMFLEACEDPVLGFRTGPRTGATTIGAIWGGAVISSRLDLPVHYAAAVISNVVSHQNPGGGLGVRPRALSTLRDTWLGLEAERLVLLHAATWSDPLEV